jgi:hypothetical protein
MAAGMVSFVLFEYGLPGKVPDALVGKWLVRGGAQDGVTLEFRHNGAFRALVSRNGQMGVVEGRVEADENALHIFSVNPHTRREELKMHIIKKLTYEEMVLEDPAGICSTLVRME